MISNQTYQIFKTASVTYFNASLFFPGEIKKDVFCLYAFVRKADDFVDNHVQDKTGFTKFRRDYQSAINGKNVSDQVIQEYVNLATKKQFESDWTESFLDVMESDFAKNNYQTIQDTIKYTYGSAEVIGLMMAQILDLPQKAYESAQMLGRSMQYANFIRDIDEDFQLGRNYFPQTDLKKFGLKNLSKQTVLDNPENFKSFIDFQIDRYYRWQNRAEEGFEYIPKRSLIPVKTASDMYKWTLKQIAKDPFIVYQKKIKPSKWKVIQTGLLNSLSIYV